MVISAMALPKAIAANKLALAVVCVGLMIINIVAKVSCDVDGEFEASVLYPTEPRPRVMSSVDNATYEFMDLSVKEITPQQKCYFGAIPICL